jgi:prolyl-tRNA synthetase
MGLRVLDKDGKEIMPIMGCYGIGIERILTAAIEENHDDDGFYLPPQIAPFEVVVTPINVADEKLRAISTDIASKLERAGFDVVLDERDERPGVKFKDADLVGIPFRINVGSKKVTEGKVEVFHRSTRKSQDASILEIIDIMGKLLRNSQ